MSPKTGLEVSQPKPNWLSKTDFIILIVFSVVLLFSRIPSMFEPWWYGDENIYMALGQGIARGQWLYLEVWDNKPPFIYLVYAASYGLFGNVLWPLRLLNAVLAIVGLVGFFLIGRQVLDLSAKVVYWATGLLTLFLATGLEGTIFNAEGLFVPLVWGGFLILMLQLEKHFATNNFSRIWLLAGSVLWSLAAFTKMQAIVEIGLLSGTLVILYLRSYYNQTKQLHFWRDSEFWQFFAVIGGIIILPYALAGLMYGLRGEFSTLIYSIVGFGGDYIQSGKDPVVFGVSLGFVTGVQLRAVMMVFIFLWLSYLHLCGCLQTKWFVILNWLSVAIFATLLSERNYPHYLLQVLPVFILAGAVVVHELWHKKIDLAYKTTSAVAAVLVLQTFLTTFTGGNFVWNYFSPIHYFSGFGEVAAGQRSLQNWQAVYNEELVYSQPVLTQKIQALTESEDKIYVVANRPDIYFWSERLSGQRFVADYHFTQSEVPTIYQSLLEQETKLILIDKRSDKAEQFKQLMQDDFRQVDQEGEDYTIWLKQ